MVEQFKFSDAAKLFAENKSIVNKMAEIYYQEINNYLDNIKTEISAFAEPLDLHEQKTTGENRSWWITDKKTNEVENGVYFWISIKSPEIVFPGKLVINAELDYLNLEVLSFLRDSLQNSEYSKYCMSLTGTKRYTIAVIEIDYREEINIQKIAQTVFDILNYLREKHLGFNNKNIKH